MDNLKFLRSSKHSYKKHKPIHLLLPINVTNVYHWPIKFPIFNESLMIHQWAMQASFRRGVIFQNYIIVTLDNNSLYSKYNHTNFPQSENMNIYDYDAHNNNTLKISFAYIDLISTHINFSIVGFCTCILAFNKQYHLCRKTGFIYFATREYIRQSMRNNKHRWKLYQRFCIEILFNTTEHWHVSRMIDISNGDWEIEAEMQCSTYINNVRIIFCEMYVVYFPISLPYKNGNAISYSLEGFHVDVSYNRYVKLALNDL